MLKNSKSVFNETATLYRKIKSDMCACATNVLLELFKELGVDDINLSAYIEDTDCQFSHMLYMYEDDEATSLVDVIGIFKEGDFVYIHTKNCDYPVADLVTDDYIDFVEEVILEADGIADWLKETKSETAVSIYVCDEDNDTEVPTPQRDYGDIYIARKEAFESAKKYLEANESAKSVHAYIEKGDEQVDWFVVVRTEDGSIEERSCPLL